jgi:cyclic pyranopterin monophosphate synthase
MVDVTAKPVTVRLAVARGEIHMRSETVRLAAGGRVPKGNVLEAARMAGIMAAKRTGDLIPLCHPLGLTGVEVSFRIAEDRIEAEATAKTADRTGVEMEALTAVSVALLTVYDMCKAVDRDMVISRIRLDKKTGGRSGTYLRKTPPREGPDPVPGDAGKDPTRKTGRASTSRRRV